MARRSKITEDELRAAEQGDGPDVEPAAGPGLSAAPRAGAPAKAQEGAETASASGPVALRARTSAGWPQCQRVVAETGRQCIHAAVEGRRFCVQHHGRAGRPPIHASRSREAGQHHSAVRVQRLQQLTDEHEAAAERPPLAAVPRSPATDRAEAPTRGKRGAGRPAKPPPALGPDPNPFEGLELVDERGRAVPLPYVPSNRSALHQAIEATLTARRKRYAGLRELAVNPGRALAESKATLAEFEDAINDPELLVAMASTALGKEPDELKETDVLEYRNKLLPHLAREQRDTAATAVQIAKFMAAQQVLEDKVLPFIRQYGEAMRRVLGHYIKDGRLLADVVAAIELAMRVQEDSIISDALIWAEKEGR